MTNTNDSGIQPRHPDALEQPTHRLPCRGCLADCSNYPTCDGRPWRADAPLNSAAPPPDVAQL